MSAARLGNWNPADVEESLDLPTEAVKAREKLRKTLAM
jgi:hypothetical protein